jgi:hypothetical protein
MLVYNILGTLCCVACDSFNSSCSVLCSLFYSPSALLTAVRAHRNLTSILTLSPPPVMRLLITHFSSVPFHFPFLVLSLHCLSARYVVRLRRSFVNLILQKANIFSSRLDTGNVCVSGTLTAACPFVCFNCRWNIYFLCLPLPEGDRPPPCPQTSMGSPSRPWHMC